MKRIVVALALLLVLTDASHSVPGSGSRLYFVVIRADASANATSTRATVADLQRVFEPLDVRIAPLMPVRRVLRKGSDFPDRILLVIVPSVIPDSEIRNTAMGTGIVEYVERVHTLRVDDFPNDPEYPSQWGVKRVGMELAWQKTTGSSKVVIGVIDTGVEYDHPDLVNQFWINTAEDANGNGRLDPWPDTELRDGVPGDFDGVDNDGNGFTDDVIGYDFTDQHRPRTEGTGDNTVPDPDPADEMGHGTAVAGIIGAEADNGIGVAGVAPGCRMMVLRAFDGTGVGLESDVARAVIYAVRQGARVINMSFGDVAYSRVLRDVLRWAFGRGVVMVASAGNSASDELHYPSAYDETISVGATGFGDGLASFSNFGESVDLVAPGLDITTTARDGKTDSFNGTSASAPFVSAAAALILSLNPRFDPEEVRGTLIVSCRDVGARGWDHRTGAGRLDVNRALDVEYPSVVRIYSPSVTAGITADTITVVGTAASPVMTGYTLSYGLGLDPQQWETIVPKTNRQVVNETLATWNVGALPDTTVVLRLSALSDKGTTLEDRVVIRIDRTPATFLGTLFLPVVEGRTFGVVGGYISDEPTLGRFWFRRYGSGGPWKWVSMDGGAENNLFIGTSHHAFIDAEQLREGVEYEFYFSAENESGLIAEARGPTGNFRYTVPVPVPSSGFVRKNYSLPAGRIFKYATDFNGDNKMELLSNDFAESNRLMIREWQSSGFIERTVPALGFYLPRAVGDVTGDGRQELLASFVRNGYLYHSSRPGGFPDRLIWADTIGSDFWPITITDIDNDGTTEVLAVTSDTTIGVFRWNASSAVLETITVLENPSAPGPDMRNEFGAPAVGIGDFNNNGRKDFLFADNDGDIFIYEYRAGNDFDLIFLSENDFEGASAFVAAGDVNGDGRDEAVIMFRTGSEDVVPFWWAMIFALDNGNKPNVVWEQGFYGVELGGRFGVFSRIENSLSLANIDSDAEPELIITVFPELYIFDYDAAKKTMVPAWYQPLVNTNAVVVEDYDGNGVAEFGFNIRDSLVFYEKDVAYSGPSKPLALSVEYQTPTTVQLRWIPAEPGTEIILYKGNSVQTLAEFGRFQGSSATDPTLELDKTYVYAVAAFDSTGIPQVSSLLVSRELNPHEAPRILTADYLGDGQVRMVVSQDLRTAAPNPESFQLGAARHPESAVIINPREVLLSFGDLADGTYNLSAPGLRDAEGIPFVPDVTTFEVVNRSKQELYILRVEYKGGNAIDVWFNLSVDPATASNHLNYILSPGMNIRSATLDTQDPTLVHLLAGGNRRISALGLEYTIRVVNVLGANGIPITTGAGSTAGFVINLDNLEDVFVFPSPVRVSEGQATVTFANLTRRATVVIFSFDGKKIAQVEEEDGNGGVTWDLRRSDGSRVGPGIYLYRVSGINALGEAVESVTKKFAVIR